MFPTINRLKRLLLIMRFFSRCFLFFIFKSITASAGTMELSSKGIFDSCDIYGTDKRTSVSFVGPDRLIIPPGTANGTVIYKEQKRSPSRIIFGCSRLGGIGGNLSVPLGIVPNTDLVEVTPSGSIFEIKGTGLSWRVQVSGDTNVQGFLPSFNTPLIVPSAGIDVFQYLGGDRGLFELSIIKTDDRAGTSKIKSGTFGTVFFGISTRLPIIDLNIQKEIPIQQPTCITPNVNVSMGEYSIKALSAAGAQTQPIAFNLKFLNCTSAVKKITYRFLSNAETIDKDGGVISLNKTSTARNIGLRIMNSNNVPVSLDKNYPALEFKPGSTNLDISLSAAYVHLSSELITPGSANADVTFVVNYN